MRTHWLSWNEPRIRPSRRFAWDDPNPPGSAPLEIAVTLPCQCTARLEAANNFDQQPPQSGLE
jgi:hypothetical protein